MNNNSANNNTNWISSIHIPTTSALAFHTIGEDSFSKRNLTQNDFLYFLFLRATYAFSHKSFFRRKWHSVDLSWRNRRSVCDEFALHR